MDEAKEDMVDVVKFLQNPEAFHQVGAKIPKGQLKVLVNDIKGQGHFIKIKVILLGSVIVHGIDNFLKYSHRSGIVLE